MRLRRLLAIALLALAATPSAHAAAATRALQLQEVDLARYPLVDVRLTLPPELGATGKKPVFTVTENGEELRLDEASPLQSRRLPVDVVLLVDTSGSMQGRPLRHAREAAERFIAAMGDQDEVALVAFSSSPKVLTPFTTDKSALRAALGGLTASGETAVYDGLVRGAGLFEGRSGRQRNLVLLSDGGDTVSSSSLDAAAAAIAKAKAPVHAVALESPEFDPKPLALLAKRSGGRLVPVKDSASLGKLFEGIARELQDQYVLSFKGASPRTADLELAVAVVADGLTAEGRTILPNPSLGAIAPVSTSDLVVPTPNGLLMVLALVATFGGGALLALGVSLVLSKDRTAMDQLRYYEQIQASRGPVDEGDDTGSVLREAVGFVAGRRGFVKLAHEKLERAGLPLRPTEYIYFHVLTVVSVAGVSQLLFRSVPLSVMLAVVAVVVPLVALELAIEKRRHAFEDQLPDLLTLVAGSLRAGWGLLQSIDLVVEEMGDPASSEFKRVRTEASLGLPLERALEKMADRSGSDDLRWAVSAINIQREVGGNLAEVLDIVAATMRDRAELRRHVHALTAEGRLSAMILLILPFFELGAIMLLNPVYMAPLFQSPTGLMLCFIGAGMLVVGAVWLKKAVAVEV